MWYYVWTSKESEFQPLSIRWRKLQVGLGLWETGGQIQFSPGETAPDIIGNVMEPQTRTSDSRERTGVYVIRSPLQKTQRLDLVTWEEHKMESWSAITRWSEGAKRKPTRSAMSSETREKRRVSSQKPREEKTHNTEKWCQPLECEFNSKNDQWL